MEFLFSPSSRQQHNTRLHVSERSDLPNSGLVQRDVILSTDLHEQRVRRSSDAVVIPEIVTFPHDADRIYTAVAFSPNQTTTRTRVTQE